MSGHEELARRMYAAWNERGPAAMVPDYWHEDIVWHDDPVMPDRADHRGTAATTSCTGSVIDTVGACTSR